MTERSFLVDHGGEDLEQAVAEDEAEAEQVSAEQARSALRQCRRELQQVLAVTDSALSALGLDELVATLMDRVRELIRADTVALLLREGDELVVNAISGAGVVTELGARFPVRFGFAGRVAEARRPLFQENIEPAEGLELGPGEQGIQTLLGVPLLRDGTAVGVLQAGMRRSRTITSEDLRLVQLVADRAARAIHRVQLFEEARRSEQRFRALVEATREYAIILLDPDGRVLDWNRGAEQLLGYAPSEITGLHFSRFFTPEDLDLGRPQWELKTAAGGGRAQDDNWLVRKDGTRLWANGVTTALRDETGALWAYAKVVRDQTEQKLSEETEWRAAREIEDLYNHAPCGYHTLDQAGRITRVNDTELQWLGWDRGQVLGRQFADFLTPESRQTFLEQFPDLKTRPWLRDLELELVRRNDGPFPVLLSATSVYDAAGRFMMSRSTLFDLTERKQTEQVTRRQQQALLALAKDPKLTSGDLAGALRLVTEACARALGVERVGVWLFTADQAAIRAADYYYLGEDRHAPGAVLSSKEFRSYLRALEKERVLAADDVRTDPRVRELRDSLFLLSGITSMMAAPVRHSGQVVGIVSHDHVGPLRIWTLEEQSFAGSIADLVSLAISGAERREVEEALRGTSAAVEASMDGVAILNRDGCYTYVNEAHAQLYGYFRPDQLLGKSWKELYAPEELRRFEEGIMPALADAGRWRGEAEGRRRNGTLFPQELSLTALQDGGLICVVRDNTERKRAEKEIRFLADAGEVLTASLGYEETLQQVARLMVSSMADLCIIDLLDEVGNISRVAVAHADPAKQKLAERLRQYPPDPGSKAAISEALRAGVPLLTPVVGAARLRTAARDGEHLSILRALNPRSAMIVPLFARGRVLGAISLVYGSSQRRYSSQDLPLAGELARRAAMAIDNARLYEHQKKTALTLQQSLLPAALPDVPGVSWAACYRPAGEGLEVGGDFYDVFPEVGDGGIAVVIGDVSGKGVGAATVTALTRHTTRAVTMYDVVPSHVLSQLNHAIIQQGQGFFVTAIFACLGPQPPADKGMATGRKLTFASGGHLPPLLLRPDGTVEALGEPGMLLGFFPEPEFPDCEVQLQPDDLVLFYTDGVTEARRQRELYGEERLAQLLSTCRGLSPQQTVERIEHTALEFQDGRPRDDIAILALRILPADRPAGGDH